MKKMVYSVFLCLLGLTLVNSPVSAKRRTHVQHVKTYRLYNFTNDKTVKKSKSSRKPSVKFLKNNIEVVSLQQGADNKSMNILDNHLKHMNYKELQATYKNLTQSFYKMNGHHYIPLNY